MPGTGVQARVRGEAPALFRSAGKRGVAFLELRSRETSLTSVVVQDGMVDRLGAPRSRGVAVRAMARGRWGFASTSDFSPSGLRGAVEAACDMAKHLPAGAPFFVPPPPHADIRAESFVPMVRDLIFLWQETPQETLDEQKQKVRESVRGALMDWARAKGEGNDYVDNLPLQRFNPPGHWYEVANLFRNGALAQLLREHPYVETLMLHNIDTLGADLDPAALGSHLESGNVLTFEVVPRRISDRGGGLARVNGSLRLLEGLAQPREEEELKLRYYNSMTTWIQIDPLLTAFGLTRADLDGPEDRIAEAVRRMAQRVPTYVTIKDVKRRWGHGQEDVYPVAQFEKLWSDMTTLADLACGYIAVPRRRGQQLKDLRELDPWANDGGKEYVASLCDFS